MAKKAVTTTTRKMSSEERAGFRLHKLSKKQLKNKPAKKATMTDEKKRATLIKKLAMALKKRKTAD